MKAMIAAALILLPIPAPAWSQCAVAEYPDRFEAVCKGEASLQQVPEPKALQKEPEERPQPRHHRPLSELEAARSARAKLISEQLQKQQ